MMVNGCPLRSDVELMVDWLISDVFVVVAPGMARF